MHGYGQQVRPTKLSAVVKYAVRNPTHHLPSMQSVSAQYKQELTSCAFASHLDQLVEQADYWVHGHTHDSFDYMLGKCRVLCNPRGYPINRITGKYENQNFNSQLIVEVE